MVSQEEQKEVKGKNERKEEQKEVKGKNERKEEQQTQYEDAEEMNTEEDKISLATYKAINDKPAITKKKQQSQGQ
ncbi:10636_t:CDS:2 [Acaulospora morrowiae]|uniref:10636_t:CDS:1 n=1 Tax=Acaulospora morrowiae TaxID=94023 RepID=A0A9N9AB32_9GLOM|nr:10636_t:CDS:2 [Acaulospora morrowiae]